MPPTTTDSPVVCSAGCDGLGSIVTRTTDPLTAVGLCRECGEVLIYRKIKISFLQHLGPRGTSSAHRPTELVGNDRDARRCRECGGIDTNGSASAYAPRPRISSG